MNFSCFAKNRIGVQKYPCFAVSLSINALEQALAEANGDVNICIFAVFLFSSVSKDIKSSFILRFLFFA